MGGDSRGEKQLLIVNGERKFHKDVFGKGNIFFLKEQLFEATQRSFLFLIFN
jgi:hypothetical protein